MLSDPCEAGPLRQDRQWFLLAVSIAGRFLCVAVRALDCDAYFKHLDDKCCAEASLPAATLQTMSTDFRIAPRIIFGDINYVNARGVTTERRDELLRSGVNRTRS